MVGYGNDERYNQGRNLLWELYYNPGGRRRETKQLQNEQQLVYVRSAAIRAFEYRYKFDVGMPRVLKRIDLPKFSLETSGLDIQAEQSTYAVDFPLSNPLWLGNDQEREQAFYLADTTLLLRQFLYLLLAGSTKQLAIGFGQNYFIDACPVEKRGKTVAGHTLYVNLYDLDPTYDSDLSTFLFKEYTLELAVVWKNQEDQAGYSYQDAPSTILLTLSQAYDSTPARNGRKAKDTWNSRYMVELINRFETSVLIYNRRLGLA